MCSSSRASACCGFYADCAEIYILAFLNEGNTIKLIKFIKLELNYVAIKLNRFVSHKLFAVFSHELSLI